MKVHWTVLCVVVLVVATSAAHCQTWFAPFSSVRAMGMGNVGTAVTGTADVVYFNPAGLPMLEQAPDGEANWTYQAQGIYEVDGQTDYMSLAIAGSDGINGVGALWADFDAEGASWWDAGYGRAFGENWSLGASVMAGDIFNETVFSIGGIYQWPMPGTGRMARFGVVAQDVTDETGHGPLLHAGAAVPVGEQLLLAVDVADITDEADTCVSFGGELTLSQGWCLRAGSIDSPMSDAFTVGVGFQGEGWRLDAAWVDWDGNSPDDSIFIGATHTLQ